MSSDGYVESLYVTIKNNINVVFKSMKLEDWKKHTNTLVYSRLHFGNV